MVVDKPKADLVEIDPSYLPLLPYDSSEKTQKSAYRPPKKNSDKIFLAHTLESDPQTPSENFRVGGGRVVEIWVIKNFGPQSEPRHLLR